MVFIAKKMAKKCKTPNIDIPFFKHILGQNTSKSGLNVMKYHCGVGKTVW